MHSPSSSSSKSMKMLMRFHYEDFISSHKPTLTPRWDKFKQIFGLGILEIFLGKKHQEPR